MTVRKKKASSDWTFKRLGVTYADDGTVHLNGRPTRIATWTVEFNPPLSQPRLDRIRRILGLLRGEDLDLLFASHPVGVLQEGSQNLVLSGVYLYQVAVALRRPWVPVLLLPPESVNQINQSALTRVDRFLGPLVLADSSRPDRLVHLAFEAEKEGTPLLSEGRRGGGYFPISLKDFAFLLGIDESTLHLKRRHLKRKTLLQVPGSETVEEGRRQNKEPKPGLHESAREASLRPEAPPAGPEPGEPAEPGDLEPDAGSLMSSGSDQGATPGDSVTSGPGSSVVTEPK